MAGSADGALSGSAFLGRDRGAGGFGEGTGFGSGAGLGAGAAAEPEHASGAGGTGGPGGAAAGGGVGGSYRQHAAMQDKKRELEQLIKERSARIELVHSARDRCVPFVHVKIAFRAEVPHYSYIAAENLERLAKVYGLTQRSQFLKLLLKSLNHR